MNSLKKFYRSDDELGDEYCHKIGCKACFGSDYNCEPNGFGCEKRDEFVGDNEHLIMDCDAISFLLEEENKRLKEEVERYQHLIQYIHDTCLCDRFKTKGFDYHEKHPKREKNNGASRPKTPIDAIESHIGFEWKYDDSIAPYKSWKELRFKNFSNKASP